MQPRRVLGYARVSSVEQALGTSLEDQQNVIREYAQKRGLKVHRMYVEAESAVHEKIERREQVRALMSDVRAGDLVLVDKIDRWSRDPEFTYASTRQMLGRGASFYAIGDDCDPSTPAGDSMMGLRIFFAREEHKRIKLRTVGTRKLLKDRGYFADGLPPWGYARQDVRGPDRNVLLVDEVAAEAVRDVFRRCIGGEAISEIVEATGINRDKVHATLHNRVYLGEVRNASGNWIRGKHQAIIDARTFARAAAALERRRYTSRLGRSTSETAAWWLRDVARCALCSAKLAAAYAGPHDARRHYFRCFARCTPRYVRVSAAEEQCDPLVEARLVDLADLLADARSEAAPKAKADIDGKLALITTRRLKLADTYADGGLSREEYRAKLDRLEVEWSRLEAQRAEEPPVSREHWRSALRKVKAIVIVWGSATPEERRRIVNTIAVAALLAHGRVPRFEWVTAEDLARRG